MLHQARCAKTGLNNVTKTSMVVRRSFTTRSGDTILGTIRHHPNSSLKYLGLAGALGLGGMIAYGASRPAEYVPSSTRDMMRSMGGATHSKLIRSRIMKTFGYYSGSIAITAATAYLLFTRGVHCSYLAIYCI